MINYEVHPNNIVAFKIPLKEFSFANFFEETSVPIQKMEKEAEKTAKKLLGFEVELLNIERFIPLLKKNNLPLIDFFSAKRNKINKLVFVAIRKDNNFFGSIFRPSIDQEFLNIAGFYQHHTNIIILTVFLRDVTINKNNYKDRLTPNALSNVYKVSIHELTHYTYANSIGYRKEVDDYIEGFYSDFFKLIFDKDSIYRFYLKPYYDKLKLCESSKNCNFPNIINDIIKILEKHTGAAKDQMLLRETIGVYKAMIDPKAMNLFSKLFFQKSMKKVYEKRGIVDIVGQNTIHGQELIYPSEIMCVTQDKLVYSNTARKYAHIMLRHI